MSIFKGTLAPQIAAQLKARETIVFQTDRDDDFLRYTTGKNSWVRMSSFVNVINKKSGKSDDTLAKKWVLEGGVPYGNNKPRYNVGNLAEAAYGGNLADDATERPYGFRPMPGITSVTVSNKGAYGSLRQATIRFQCWDRHQLDQLEKLYMRVGFTVLVEWGWSQYIDHSPAGLKGINTIPGNIKVENFLKNRVIDVFDKSVTGNEDGIYEIIDKNVLSYKGNWDAILGYIQNFSWQLLPNGGFDCTTVLISRGEVLSEIKGSSNPYTMIDSNLIQNNSVKTQYTAANGLPQENPVLSLFEKIFLNLKAYINQGEIYDANGEFYIKYDGVPTAARRLSNSQDIQKQVEQTIQNIKVEYDKTIRYTRDIIPTTPGFELDKYSSQSNIVWTPEFLKNNNKPIIGGVDGTTLEYIEFSDLIHLLNTFFIPKDPTTHRQIVNIVNPLGTEFLVCEDTVSIDPTTCLFQNSRATFITNIDSHSCGATNIGFNPLTYAQRGDYNNVNGFTSSFGDRVRMLEPITTKSSTTKEGDPILIGNLGRLSICVSKIIEVYRETMTSDGVSIIDFLQRLLEQVSFALGGINDFKVYTEKKLVHIIDAKYLETSGDPEGSYSQKFKFDLIGLKSICRDVKINSRIFSEQASMIAIGAAASGENRNLGDIYSTTQQKFNEDLKDRLMPPILAVSSDTYNANDYYYDLFKNLVTLETYLKRKVIGYVDPCNIPDAPYGVDADGHPLEKIIIPSREEIVNASSLLNTFLLQLDGKDLDFKALIPLELEITLDGISGFVIGQIFTIDSSILPTFYEDNNIGFIITGVNQTLQNNDWTTTLKTQMCLLDNDKLKSSLNLTDKQKLKTIINRIRSQVNLNSWLALAMADYLTYLTVGILFASLPQGSPPRKVPNLKKDKIGYDGTKTLPANITTSNTAFFTGTTSTKYYVYIQPESTWFDQTDLTLEAKDSVNGAVERVNELISTDMPFYNKDRTGNSYLEKWYNIASTKGLPNFPPSFDKLVNAEPVLGTIINLEDDLEKFNKEVLKEVGGTPRPYWFHNIYLTTGKDNFFYRYFGATPLRKIKQDYYRPGTLSPTLLNSMHGGNKSLGDLAINDMFRDFLYNIVVPFINREWVNTKQYIDPRVYGSSLYSVESIDSADPSRRTTIWLDGEQITVPPSL